MRRAASADRVRAASAHRAPPPLRPVTCLRWAGPLRLAARDVGDGLRRVTVTCRLGVGSIVGGADRPCARSVGQNPPLTPL